MLIFVRNGNLKVHLDGILMQSQLNKCNDEQPVTATPLSVLMIHVRNIPIQIHMHESFFIFSYSFNYPPIEGK